MEKTLIRQNIRKWVDSDQWLVGREIFVSEEIYKLEMERIFARAWLFVGHESQIPKPGDYFVGRMGEESVIMTRDRQDKIHVFLNSCMHRGMKVCRYDEGNTPVFTCPYHGWSFGLDGKLVGVPYFKEAYHSELKKDEWGLVEARMFNYKGTIWACWDKTAPDFMEYLGSMAFYMDDVLDGRDGTPGGSEVVGGVQKWITPANWKFGAENRAGDGYHNVSHRSVDLVGIGPSAGQGRRDNEIVKQRRLTATLPNGHAMMFGQQMEDVPWIPTFQSNPVVAEWARHTYEERKKNLGDRARVMGSGGNVFPNMSFWCRQPRRVAVWHPAGNALRSEYWSWALVDKTAPQEYKDLMRHYAMRYSGPAGMTEQDDMENWNYATAASKGTIAKRHPYNYQIGRGHQFTDPTMPGLLVQGVAEQNQMGMYNFWAELMMYDTWDELMDARKKQSKP
ncbi:MAG: aromatic ring-hydroxylating dioxygenase subunit alpha [SAR202 cluster bacterium]|nr:aromatic ring-hydroxylating dioxygenase subunit alpha [SAR202 cluster bacterium]